MHAVRVLRLVLLHLRVTHQMHMHCQLFSLCYSVRVLEVCKTESASQCVLAYGKKKALCVAEGRLVEEKAAGP